MTLETVWEFMQGPIASAVSLLGCFVGIILAIVFYFKSRRRTKTCYSFFGRTLIESKQPTIEGLSILYKDQQRSRVTVSKVAIWNGGTEPIRTADIASSVPLSVEVASGAEVLAKELIYSSDPANQFNIHDVQSESEEGTDAVTSIPFSFEFLDPKQGAVIQLVHTGDWAHGIEIKGKVIGASSWECSPSAHEKLTSTRSKMMGFYKNPKAIGWMLIAASAGIILFGALAIIFPAFGVVIIVLGFLSGCASLQDLISRVPSDISAHLGYDNLSCSAAMDQATKEDPPS